MFEVPSDESKGGIGFITDFIDICWPFYVFTDDNTKVPIFLHLFQNMIVENVVCS